jgi:hypothetical protein
MAYNAFVYGEGSGIRIDFTEQGVDAQANGWVVNFTPLAAS